MSEPKLNEPNSQAVRREPGWARGEFTVPEEFDVGVTVPDLPGCFGVAPDMEDARTMTDEAITFHIDEQHGDVLPKPTSRRRSR